MSDYCCTKIKTRYLYLYDIFVFNNRISLVVAPNDSVYFLNNVQSKTNFDQIVEIV